MTVRLDHTIVPARDGEAAARWFADIFGAPDPIRFSIFWQVSTANGVDLDFDSYGPDGQFTTGHYAFRVDESEFDAIFERIRSTGSDYWADPGQREPRSINHHDGGRGVYFPNPDGHLFEIITVPYGGVDKG